MKAYLEGAHQGEFTHGSLKDVQERVRCDTRAPPEAVDDQCTTTYTVPTHTLPRVPPARCENHSKNNNNDCVKCQTMRRWWKGYEDEVDDIVLRTNLHTCREGLKPELRKVKRTLNERRGCLSKTGICKARFPREIFENTTVEADGHINLKHLEANLNTFSQVVTFFSRSNTDVTSLLSGTSVKAVISYVSDYVSKLGLKTYQAFASVHDVFKKNDDIMNTGSENTETAR
ncbi:hypothetical protein C8R43DRAFT_874346, partial [Mycena crocata]